MAELFGPNREPIALVRTMTALDAGTRWMTMRVWGKAIRDAGVPGPYEVRDVLLTRDSTERGDYDPGPTILSAHRTAAYTLDYFSTAPYVEPTVDRGEEIGANHPSQANNPAPLYPPSARATLNSHCPSSRSRTPRAGSLGLCYGRVACYPTRKPRRALIQPVAFRAHVACSVDLM